MDHLDVFDSEANAVFGRASGGRGAGAFPQVRKLSLVELGTPVETAIASGGYLDDPQRTGHGETHRLITNLLDEHEHPALELVALYHERWEITSGGRSRAGVR